MEQKYDYVILDDVYLNEEIELVVGRDIEKIDARNNEITLTYEQLSDIIIDVVRQERQRKGGD